MVVYVELDSLSYHSRARLKRLMINVSGTLEPRLNLDHPLPNNTRQ